MNQPEVRASPLGGSRAAGGLLGNPPSGAPRMPSMDRTQLESQRLSANRMGRGGNYGRASSQRSRYDGHSWPGRQRENERRSERWPRGRMSNNGQSGVSRTSPTIQVSVNVRRGAETPRGRARGRADMDMTRRGPAVESTTSQTETSRHQGAAGNSRPREEKSVIASARADDIMKQSEVIDITKQDAGRRGSDIVGDDDDVICIGQQTLVTPPPPGHSPSLHGVSKPRDGRRHNEPLHSTREENVRSEETRRSESMEKADRREERDVEIVSNPGDQRRRRSSSREISRDRDVRRTSEEREALSSSIRQSEETLRHAGKGQVSSEQAVCEDRVRSAAVIPVVSSSGERERVSPVASRNSLQLTSVQRSGVRGREDQEVVIVPESEMKGNNVGKSNVEKRSRRDDRGGSAPPRVGSGQETSQVGHGGERMKAGDKQMEADTAVEVRGSESQTMLSREGMTLSSDRERPEKSPAANGKDGGGETMDVEKEERTIASDEDEHDDFEELILKHELLQQELQKINEKEAAAKSQQERQRNIQQRHKTRRQSGTRSWSAERQQPRHPQQAKRGNRRAKARARVRSRSRVGGQERMVTIATDGQQFVRQRLENDVATFLEKGVLPLEGRSVERGKKKSDRDSSGGDDEEERLRQQLLKSMQRKGNQSESRQTAREESGSSQTVMGLAGVTQPVVLPRQSAQTVSTVLKYPMKKKQLAAAASVSKLKVTLASKPKVTPVSKPEVTSVSKVGVASKTSLLVKSVEKAKGPIPGAQKGNFIIEVNADDSDSDVDVQEVEHLQQKQLEKSSNLRFSGMSLEDKIKQLRKTSDCSVTSTTKSPVKTAATSATAGRKALTPDSIAHLPREKLEEYSRLRIEILNRERKRKQQELINPHSKRPKLTGHRYQQVRGKSQQATSQVSSSRTRVGSGSSSSRKHVGNRMASVTKSVTVQKRGSGANYRVNSEMQVAVLCTRLAAENSLLSGRVDKVELLREQLKVS